MAKFITIIGLIGAVALVVSFLGGCGYLDSLSGTKFELGEDAVFTSDGAVWELKSDLIAYMKWKAGNQKTYEPVPRGSLHQVKKGQEFVVFEVPKDHVMKIRLVSEGTDWYMWVK